MLTFRSALNTVISQIYEIRGVITRKFHKIPKSKDKEPTSGHQE